MSKASDIIGGGSGIPINGLAPIITDDLLYTAPSGTVWLRTGCVEDDVASYPDANQTTSPVGVGTKTALADDSGTLLYMRIL